MEPSPKNSGSSPPLTEGVTSLSPSTRSSAVIVSPNCSTTSAALAIPSLLVASKVTSWTTDNTGPVVSTTVMVTCTVSAALPLESFTSKSTVVVPTGNKISSKTSPSTDATMSSLISPWMLSLAVIPARKSTSCSDSSDVSGPSASIVIEVSAAEISGGISSPLIVIVADSAAVSKPAAPSST